jgi:hypothetical protein
VYQNFISDLYETQHISGDCAHHQEPQTALAASGFAYVEGCWTCSCWTLSALQVTLIFVSWSRNPPPPPANCGIGKFNFVFVRYRQCACLGLQQRSPVHTLLTVYPVCHYLHTSLPHVISRLHFSHIKFCKYFPLSPLLPAHPIPHITMCVSVCISTNHGHPHYTICPVLSSPFGTKIRPQSCRLADSFTQ